MATARELETSFGHVALTEGRPLSVIQGTGPKIETAPRAINREDEPYMIIAREIFDYYAGNEVRKGAIPAHIKDRVAMSFVETVEQFDTLRRLSPDQLAEIAGTTPEMIVNYQERAQNKIRPKSA